MSTITVQQFAIYFEQRRNAFRDLLRLSEAQKLHIQEDDYSGLLKVLEQKQQILNRVVSTHAQSGRLVEQWQSHRERFLRTDRGICEDLLAEAEGLLSMIAQSDAASTSELQSRRDTTHDQLQRIASGTQTHRAYADETESTHRFLDIDH